MDKNDERNSPFRIMMSMLAHVLSEDMTNIVTYLKPHRNVPRQIVHFATQGCNGDHLRSAHLSHHFPAGEYIPKFEENAVNSARRTYKALGFFNGRSLPSSASFS